MEIGVSVKLEGDMAILLNYAGGVNLKFEYLAENKEFIPIVANWLYTEFVENIRHGISLHNVVEKLESGKKEVLPITIVAKEGTTCIGTVSILENDLKGMFLKPWLAALVVDKQYRGAGMYR